MYRKANKQALLKRRKNELFIRLCMAGDFQEDIDLLAHDRVKY